MDYSACSPITACYHCSISCVSSSWFHFCTLLLTNTVSVVHSTFLLCFSDSLSGNLPLLHLHPSLFVSKITFPNILWYISCLLYCSLGLPGLILHLHLFQAPNIVTWELPIYYLLSLFFPPLQIWLLCPWYCKQTAPSSLSQATHKTEGSKNTGYWWVYPSWQVSPHPVALTLPHNGIWRESERQKQENESVKRKAL